MAWWSHTEPGRRHDQPDSQAIDWGSLVFTLGVADIEDFDISTVDPLTHASAPTEVKERLIDDAVSLQLQKLEELRRKFVAHGKASKVPSGLQSREPAPTADTLDLSEITNTKDDDKNAETKTRRRVKRRKREEGKTSNEPAPNEKKEKKEKKQRKESKSAKIDREQEEVAVIVPDDEERVPRSTVASSTSPFDVGTVVKKEAPKPQLLPIATPARAVAMTPPSKQAVVNSLSKSIAASLDDRVAWGGQPLCRGGPSCQFLAWGTCQYYHPPEHLPRAGFDTTLIGSERRWNVWVNNSRT